MPMKILKLILADKAFKHSFIIILIQQLLVATGTYLMGDLAANVVVNGISIPKMIILILSLILSGSLFHFLMKLQLKKAEKNILLTFFEKYQDQNFCQPTIWRNSEEKQKRHDVMIKEGQDAISSSVHFAADTVATVFNIILNSISVILVTSPILGFAIFISGLIGLWIIHRADLSITKAAESEMVAQNSLNAHLAKSWDNIVLGNKSHSIKWRAKFKNIFENSKNKSLENVKVNDSVVSLAGFITSLIVVGTVTVLVYLNQTSNAKVVALLVMLPRSMQIVMHIQVIQSYLAHWKYLLQRLKMTEETYSPVKEFPLDSFINLAEIKIEPHINFENILSNSIGRFTIKGANGSGKSSLLLKFKNQLKQNALYLPSHHCLELSQDTFSLSSGQLAICAIREALLDPSKVIFLDEWDANLSSENLNELDHEIEVLSRSKLVIEIRHRN
jgi:ABC-type phosphate transport system ATPase subunit